MKNGSKSRNKGRKVLVDVRIARLLFACFVGDLISQGKLRFKDLSFLDYIMQSTA